MNSNYFESSIESIDLSNIVSLILYGVGIYVFTILFYFILNSYSKKDSINRSTDIYYNRSKNSKLIESKTESKSKERFLEINIEIDQIMELNIENYHELFMTNPIDELDDLIGYSTNHIIDYQDRIVPLVIDKSMEKLGVSKLLICHDMQGNYLGDKFHHGCKFDLSSFQLFHWTIIDHFVYFSHHFISIPPLSWINNCHTHNKRCLGTFITEWGKGMELCDKIFASWEGCQPVAEAMLHLQRKFGFDGWLINIENELTSPKISISIIKQFLSFLTSKSKEYNPYSLIIWYDAVTIEGKLAWQDEVTDLNFSFFNCCDGIFVNYTWKESSPPRSARLIDKRKPCCDVYYGCDVFGRNTFGGGEFSSYKAIEHLCSLQQQFSSALFAPGWIHETQLPLLSTTCGKVLSFQKLQYETLQLYKKLFDNIEINIKSTHMKKLVFKQIKIPKPFDKKENYVLNYQFSLAVGEFIFINGHKFLHPFIFNKFNNLQGNSDKDSTYYDLSMQNMNNISPTILNETFSDAIGKSNIKVTLSCKNGFTGSSSLQFAGILARQYNKHNKLIPTITIPLDCIPSIQMKLIKTNSNSDRLVFPDNSQLRILGEKLDPLSIRFAIALQKDCEIAVILKFRKGMSSSKGSESCIILLPSYFSTNTNSIWSSRVDSRSKLAFEEVIGPEWESTTLSFTPSSLPLTAQRQGLQAVAQVPNESKILSHLFKSKCDPSVLQKLIDENDSQITGEILWQERSYFLSPSALTDLSTRELISVNIIPLSTKDVSVDVSNRNITTGYRCYLGYLHISHGKEYLPTCLQVPVSSNPRIDHQIITNVFCNIQKNLLCIKINCQPLVSSLRNSISHFSSMQCFCITKPDLAKKCIEQEEYIENIDIHSDNMTLVLHSRTMANVFEILPEWTHDFDSKRLLLVLIHIQFVDMSYHQEWIKIVLPNQ